LKIQNELEFEQPYYWKISGDKKDGPYCQKCYDENKKLIRLQDETNGSWRCLVCTSFFRDKNYKEEVYEDDGDAYGSYV
jgi:ribosomal protein L37AE/L43A